MRTLATTLLLLSVSGSGAVSCTPQLPVEVELVIPKTPALDLAGYSSILLSAQTSSGRVIASSKLDPKQLATQKPGFQFTVGEQVTLQVRGLDGSGNKVIAAGETTFTVGKTTAPKVTLYFGPTGEKRAFSIHPKQPNVVRDRASVISDRTGKVWIVGGFEASTTTASSAVEVYDPVALTFTLLETRLAVGTVEPMLGLVNVEGRELLVVAGGQNATGVAINAAQVIDTEKRVLGAAQTLATGARAKATVFAPGDHRLVLLGGEGPLGNEGSRGTTVLVDRALNLVTDNRLAATGPDLVLPTPRVGARLVELSGELFLAGGEVSSSVGRLDRNTGLVTDLAKSNLARSSPPCVVSSEQEIVFACGGSAVIERWGKDQSAIEIIAQEAVPEGASPRASAATLRLDDGGLLISGAPNNAVFYIVNGRAQAAALPLVQLRSNHALIATPTRTVLAIGGGANSAEILSLSLP